jgi:hypothetical protein
MKYTQDSFLIGIICQTVEPEGCPLIMSNGTVEIKDSSTNTSGGAFGQMSQLAAVLYGAPPARSTEYLAQINNNMGIASPVYAQGAPTSVGGSGSGVVAPVLAVWTTTRNIAYLGFVFIFIVIGFMIMFRRRLNPQTVISAQIALPGLVIGLILVTFSYFIAALIIDTSFLGMQLTAQIFMQSGGNIYNNQQIQGMANDSNLFNLYRSSVRFGENFNDVQSGVRDTLNSATSGVIPGGAFSLPGFLITVVGSILVGALVGGGGRSDTRSTDWNWNSYRRSFITCRDRVDCSSCIAYSFIYSVL